MHLVRRRLWGLAREAQLTPDHHYDPYDRLAPVYDWMAWSLLLPFGGEDRFRGAVVDALGITPGTRVLELGVGTGAMTRRMVDAGARVTGLDLAEPMLERARKKAPEADLRKADILAFEAEEPFDAALLAFVLHEMDPATRAGALSTAARCLRPGGRLVVLDFDGRAPFPIDPVFRLYLRLAEPEVGRDLLEGGLLRCVERAGFAVSERRSLATGTAQVLVATRP